MLLRLLPWPAAAIMLFPGSATAQQPLQPLSFFEGRTESSGTVKVLMQNPYLSHSVGRGRIEPDGSLTLVQQVFDQKKPPTVRRWSIRRAGVGHYIGTMSDASGPVAIDQIGGQFRFRFRLKNSLAVEQWVTPLADGTSARNLMTVRKFGITVATGDGMIRKLAGG